MVLASRLRVLLAAGILSLLGSGSAAGGVGITFQQLDFTWDQATTLDSPVGRIVVDVATFLDVVGQPAGYLNIVTSDGWVVQNLPIRTSFPYPTIATYFQLPTATPGPIDSIDVFIDFANFPSSTFSASVFVEFPVVEFEHNGDGRADPVQLVGPAPPAPAGTSFSPGAPSGCQFQPGMANLDAADRQSGSVAAANALDWLRSSTGLAVPEFHAPGVDCGSPLGSTQSLVATLDARLGRSCSSRFEGAGASSVALLEGLHDYLSDAGLAVRIRSRYVGPQVLQNRGLTFAGNGSPPTIAFLETELDRRAVIVGWTHEASSESGQWANVVGTGETLGTPWIAYRSDHVQSRTDAFAPPDGIDNNEGTADVDFSYVADTDGDGRLNLVNEPGQPDLDIGISLGNP